MNSRRYYLWPLMLVLVSVFCWQFFKPQPEPRIDPVRHVQTFPPYWDYARGDPNDIKELKRIIKEYDPPSIRVEVYRDGKWIEVMPAKISPSGTK